MVRGAGLGVYPGQVRGGAQGGVDLRGSGERVAGLVAAIGEFACRCGTSDSAASVVA
jgi:hypothetical protein